MVGTFTCLSAKSHSLFSGSVLNQASPSLPPSSVSGNNGSFEEAYSSSTSSIGMDVIAGSDDDGNVDDGDKKKEEAIGRPEGKAESRSGHNDKVRRRMNDAGQHKWVV